MSVKVWEKYSNDGMEFDNEEEREMATRFNKSFLRLLEITPKADRKALFDMLRAADDLYRRYGIKCYEMGIDSGLNIAIEKITKDKPIRVFSK
ncbi:hypothetical protein [Desulforamulus aquiferis]|uniref:Uncharacterized protein n=1 Tax=Desulforamulus aquiferis TaxID=1397668 RepID=A0AAW7ZA12_9FIRM|nr:hypothetical protein [Desulforamulus aquiferis]MDO7786114.1 hypothetical protein [Desulforamulus aquiferis]